jgi:hypothetical protein
VISDAIGIDLSFLKELFDGIDLETPGAILGAIAQALLGLVDAIVGALTGSGAQGNPVSAIMWALQLPMQMISSFASELGQLGEELRSQIAQVQAQLPTQPTPSLSNWTNIAGTLQEIAKPGVLQSIQFAAGYWNTAAATDKHGVNFTVDWKMVGVTRVGIAASTTMDSYVALEIYCGGFGNDALRIVTGASPNIVVIHKQMDFGNWALQNGWSYDIKIDPVTRTVYVFKNGQLLDDLTWVDADGLLTLDASHRRIVVATNCDDNDAYGFYGQGVEATVRVYDW